MLRLEDFEQDILDHLYARYAGDAGVSALLRDKAGYRVGEAGSVPALLGAVAEGRHADAGADGAKALVAALARSIGSFDSLHRGG